MAPAMESHHHRSITKSSHKPFKSRHATKGLLKDLSKGMYCCLAHFLLADNF